MQRQKKDSDKLASLASVWERSKLASPFEMRQLIGQLRQQKWSPAQAGEKDWFAELCRLCEPLQEEAFFLAPGLMPAIVPEFSNSDYSMHLHSGNLLSVYSAKLDGLLQSYVLPECREIERRVLDTKHTSLAISADGSSYAYRHGDYPGDLVVAFLNEEMPPRRFKHFQESNYYDPIEFVDSNELFLVDANGLFYFLNLQSEEFRSFEFLPRVPKIQGSLEPSFKVSNDGKILVICADWTKPTTIYALDSKERISTVQSNRGPGTQARAACISSDNSVIALASMSEIQLLSTKAGLKQAVYSLSFENDAEAVLLAISSDNKILAVLRDCLPEPELIFLELKSHEIISRSRLAETFASRNAILQILFISGSNDLLISAQDGIYRASSDKSLHQSQANFLLSMAKRSLRKVSLEESDKLDSLCKSSILSLKLRRWAEMMNFQLRQCRVTDIELSAEVPESSEAVSEFDIEIVEDEGKNEFDSV